MMIYKRKKLVFLLVFLVFVIISCDGKSKTNEISIKSFIDDHRTLIKFESDIYGYNPGDILSPFYDKTKFTTNHDIYLEQLSSEISNRNPDINTLIYNSKYLLLIDQYSSTKEYVYFIRYLESTSEGNLYMVGRMWMRILYDEDNYLYHLILLPLHLIDSNDFDQALINNERIEYDKNYKLADEVSIHTFYDYYDGLGYFNLLKEENQITLEFNNGEDLEIISGIIFPSSFILNFDVEGYVKIIENE